MKICLVGLDNLPLLVPEYRQHVIGGESVQQTLLARALARRGLDVSTVVLDYGQIDGAQWDGPRAGPEGAVASYGADDAFPITDLDDILPGLLERNDRVYYSMGGNEFDQRLLAFMKTLNGKRQSGHAPSELVALDHLLHEMRLFKSRAETSVMRQAARITVAAHSRAMRACRPGMKESAARES